jgi:hypothetical protein
VRLQPAQACSYATGFVPRVAHTMSYVYTPRFWHREENALHSKKTNRNLVV